VDQQTFVMGRGDLRKVKNVDCKRIGLKSRAACSLMVMGTLTGLEEVCN
jgi:hypothetical protein